MLAKPIPLLPARSVEGNVSLVLRTSSSTVSGVGWRKATKMRLASVAATPSAATGIPVAPSPVAAATTAGGYPAAEVCAYLKGQIPVLTAIGSPVGREANLTANLFTFFSDHGIAPDGMQLDATTKTHCPDVRSQLLTLTGLTSLAQM